MQSLLYDSKIRMSYISRELRNFPIIIMAPKVNIIPIQFELFKHIYIFE